MRDPTGPLQPEKRLIVVSDHSVRTRWYECPVCFVRMDGATAVTDTEKVSPKPGDLSVCGRCGAILVYGEKDLEVADERTLERFPEDQLQLVRSISSLIKAV